MLLSFKKCSAYFSKNGAHHCIRWFSNKQASTTTRSDTTCSNLLKELRQLDTSCLCDADKSVLAARQDHVGLKLVDNSIQPLNHKRNNTIMAGVARTVQLTDKNDFMAVLRGLEEAHRDEVLIVNTLSSTRAVAGELFCAEASRKGLAGIVVDGPARDNIHLQNYSARFYATAITPYSGTIQSVGEMQQVVTCGGVEVRPGDIVVGDSDGIVVGSVDTFENLLTPAKTIFQAEERLLQGILSGKSLASMTNFEEHLHRRILNGDSALEFRV